MSTISHNKMMHVTQFSGNTWKQFQKLCFSLRKINQGWFFFCFVFLLSLVSLFLVSSDISQLLSCFTSAMVNGDTDANAGCFHYLVGGSSIVCQAAFSASSHCWGVTKGKNNTSFIPHNNSRSVQLRWDCCVIPLLPDSTWRQKGERVLADRWIFPDWSAGRSVAHGAQSGTFCTHWEEAVEMEGKCVFG